MRLRISEAAKSRLLDTSDLSRFEIKKPRQTGLKSTEDVRRKHRDDFHGKKHDKSRHERGNRKNSDRGSVRRSPKKKQG